MFSRYNKLNNLLNRVRLLYRIQIKPLLLRRPIFFLYQKLGWRALTRDELVINSKRYRVRQFGFKESITASQPHFQGTIPKEFKEVIYPIDITIDQPFVCEITDVQLAGPAAVGFDKNGNIILETTTPFYSSKNHLEGSVSVRALALKTFSKSNVVHLNTAYSLVNAWSRNYWHWIIDSLTRLEGIEFYQEQTGNKPILIIDSNPSRWQEDSLKLLGYKPGEYISWNGSSIQVEKLIISSFRRYYNRVYSIESPSACLWVRQRILSNLPKNKSSVFLFSQKVFISRRKTFSRRIINENNVINALAPLGFVDYVLEEMSFLEQVQLFSQAKVIVAPHGAGLTNIIFGQNLVIVELFGSSLPPCFANLARGLGFRYGCLKCQTTQTGIRRQDSDMIVDIDELRNFVAEMQEYSIK